MTTKPNPASAFPDAVLVYLSPKKLRPHPDNWRTHPPGQRVVMEQLLDDVGWAGAVIWNETTGHILDGHLRWEIATDRNEKLVPVFKLQRTVAQERLILATFDRLADHAEADAEAFADLREQVNHDFEDLTAEVNGMFDATQVAALQAEHRKPSPTAEPSSWWVSVSVDDDVSQRTLLQLMQSQGRECQAMSY